MSYQPKNPRWVTLEHIVSDISNANLAPQTVQEADDLLCACKRKPENFSIFRRLWDPVKVSVQELDNYGGTRSSQLEDCDVAQLKWLLECGFTGGRRLMLLRAIILNRHEEMRVLCESLALKLLEPAAEPATINQDMETKDTWELLDKPTIYDLVAKCAIKVYGERYESLPQISFNGAPEPCQPEFHLLIEAACLQPRFTKYVVETIQWKLSISAEQAALVAIDTTPIINGLPRLAEALSPSRFRMSGPGCLRPKSQDRLFVLKTLLGFGVNPNETRFWRTFLWDEALVIINSPYPNHQGKRRLYQVFRLFIDFGANIHGSLDPIFFRTAGYHHIYVNMDNFDDQELDKPIEVAFRYKDSGLFRLLMRRSACTLRLCSHLTSGKYHGVNLELIQAIQDRNQDVIKELWDQRTPNMAVTSALEKGKIDAARDIIVNKAGELRLTPLFLEVAGLYSYHRLPAADCYEILGLLLGLGAKFDIDPQDSYKKCECQDLRTLQEHRKSKYKTLLQDASRMKDVRFFKFLMALYPSRAEAFDTHYADPPRYHQFQENRIFQLGLASTSSLEILKFLISQGFHIEEPAFECDKYCGHAFSAIYGAIMGGDIEILAYVLSEGANVFAPCGESSSAIEAAISQGRIDSLALILEAVPNAYPLALAIVEDPQYLTRYGSSEYVIEYVRTWRPADVGTDMGGSIVSVAENNLVLWVPTSNL
ncbi:hypothetical protein TWF730_011098 [Orbilia blumenaviensis]|uniref:Ankyrin n=1 Tax=Orbilia blumenaviensis TaxID=1796055 RepID=A0AAV9UJH3_9PEZI